MDRKLESGHRANPYRWPGPIQTGQTGRIPAVIGEVETLARLGNVPGFLDALKGALERPGR